MKLPIQSQPVNRKISSAKIIAGTTHNFQLSGIQLEECLARSRCREMKGAARAACIFKCTLEEAAGFPGR